MRFFIVAVLLLISANAAASQRIISLAPHITEILYAIGAGDRLVAVSDFSNYPQEAASLPSVASYASINLEAVLALKPDLVIAWRSGNPEADIRRLQQFGINVAFSDPLTLDSIASEIRLFGELTNLQNNADKIADEFQQQLNALREEYQQKTPVSVFFAMGTAPISTVANNAWPQQILTLCAAKNAFANVKGDYPQVGIEQVITAQPEVIIQPAQSGFVADFSFWYPFSSIPAVKASQYLTINADHLYRTTPRTLLGIKQLCQGVDVYR